MDLWKDIGKMIILIIYLVEEVLLLGECFLVMVLCSGCVYKEYCLLFVDFGVGNDLCEVKKYKDYVGICEEILEMIWNMEEEIMGRVEENV